MKKNLAAMLAGLIFSLGLVFSGMTLPQKIIGFLDVFGKWDPTLCFVMIGAISVHFILYRIIMRRSHPVLSTRWHLPHTKKITPRLVVGAASFGIGWGLAGYCPGPAITSLVSLQKGPFIFVFGMIFGMWMWDKLSRLYNSSVQK